MDTLSALRRNERVIALARWVAVVVALVQVQIYVPPSPALERAAAQARPLGFALVGALAGVGLVAEAAARFARTPGSLRWLGGLFLAADVAVGVGFVYLYAFDPVSAQWALLTVLPLEGALRYQLAGALGVWATVAPLYVVRDLMVTAAPFSPGALTYRLGLLLVIAVFAGLSTRDLVEQRRVLQDLSAASRQLVGRLEPLEILRVLCRESVRCLDAEAAVVHLRDGEGFRAVAGHPQLAFAAALDHPDALANGPSDGPAWVERQGHRPGRLVVPLRVPESDSVHLLVVRPGPGRRWGTFDTEVAAALAESAALALATTRVLAAGQRSNERLRYLEALRTRFVATIAHDLRLPLTVLKGVSRLLHDRRDAISPERMDDLLASVERQANRLSRLADDLLDAARMDADRLALHVAPCDLRSVVAATVADSEEDVEVDFDGDLTLRADGARLERVLWNLLSNAEKYGKPPFVVRVWREGAEAVIELRDHGPGLASQQQEQLFADFADSGDAASVGLGLAIVWRLVAAHGGTVTYADAEPGARFTVRLPVAGPKGDDDAEVDRTGGDPAGTDHTGKDQGRPLSSRP